MNKYGLFEWSYLLIETTQTGHCGNNAYDTRILRDNCKACGTQAPNIWAKCNGDNNSQTHQLENKWGFSPPARRTGRSSMTARWAERGNTIRSPAHR